MESEEMVVLARSAKHGGRCIAGVSVADGVWLRPVAPRTASGALFSNHFRLEEGYAGLLDVVRFTHEGSPGLACQPENRVLTGQPWELVGRLAPEDAYGELGSLLQPGPSLLGTRATSITEARGQQGLDASLTLVEPDWVVFRKDHYGNRPITRAEFELNGHVWDLPLTDQLVKRRLVRPEIEDGEYALEDLGIEDYEHLVLTVSLGDAWQGSHYLLVAAVHAW